MPTLKDATDGHVESKTHKKFVKDWKETPSGWDSHFKYYWKGEKYNPRPVSPPSTTELDEEPPPPPPGLSAAEVQSLRDEVHELRAEVTALHTLKMQPLIDEVQGLRTDLEALRAEVGQVAPVMGQVVAP